MKRNKKTQKKRQGFTLIEVLVVSTIIVVVAAVGLASYSTAQVKARDAQRAKDLENVRTTLLLFRTENGYYPIAGLMLPNRMAFSFPRQVLARMAGVFRVQEAQAVAIDDGYTPPPIDDATPTPKWEEATATPVATGIIKVTPTPTPTPVFETIQPTPIGTPVSTIVPTPTPTPTSTPISDEDTTPQDKLSYDDMMDILVAADYYTANEAPRDPVNDNQYYYGYSSDGADFELTARLEADGSVMTLAN